MAADSPARVLLNGTMKFTAYSGCDYCYHPAKYYGNAMRYPIDGIIKNRNTKYTIKLMFEAAAKGLRIKGVKTVSPFILLKGFGVVHGFSPDYLHILVRAAKSVTVYILKIISPKQRPLLNDILLILKVPSKLSKLPKSLKEMGDWKAKDWENYVLSLENNLTSDLA